MKLNAAWEALKRTVTGQGNAATQPLSVPDQFPLDSSSSHYPAHCLIDDFYASLPEPKLASLVKPAQHPTARLVLESPQPEQFTATEAILSRRVWLELEFEKQGSMDAVVCEFRDILQSFSLLLYRREPCTTPDQAASLVWLVAMIILESGSRNFEKDIPALLRVCESLAAQGQWSENLGKALCKLKESLSMKDAWEGADRRRAKQTIDRILSTNSSQNKAGKVIRKILKGLHIGATGKGTAAKGPDGFPKDRSSPHFELHARIDEFLAEVPDFTEYYRVKPADFATGRAILESSTEEQIQFIEALTLRRVWVHKAYPKEIWTSYGVLDKVGKLLWRRNPPFTAAQVATLLAIVTRQLRGTHWFDDDLAPILKVCEGVKARNELTSELKGALLECKAAMRPGSQWESAARGRFRDAIDRLAATKAPAPLDPGEAWSNAVLEDLKQMPARDGEAWSDLLAHCRLATASKPTQKWTRAAEERLVALGRDKFKARVVKWFDLAPLPRPVHVEPRSRWDPDPDMLYTDRNSLLLKGLVWCCAGWKDAEISRALSNLAEACFKKVRMLGPRCPRVGNACLYSLGSTGSQDAAAQLSRLDQTVKQPTAKKFIDKSLNKAAELTGQTREELEESTVPDYGLDAKGRLVQTFGSFTAELQLTESADVEISWLNSAGKVQDSVPAEVKKSHAGELKKFKRTVKEIGTMLSAHRIRLERLFLAEREWPLDVWRARYLDHRLLSHLTRRLIWHFQLGKRTALGIRHDGKMVDVNDRPLDWLAPETRVRLWHPIGFPVETVAAWRRWLESHQISQPFKQAHREIYVLTDAERRTNIYSNRFAAHILKQHQFAALAHERGWKYTLQGNFDSHSTPTLLLPRWNLGIDFWVNPAGGNEETSHAGIYLYVATDQVRFGDANGPRPLAEVPALVFSEAMRDVDLFVGVCGLGNNPEWSDTGEAGQFGAYWQAYSFGDLSATAQTRRDVLERLLPRLKISAQCSLSGKFLVVKGSLRTYKIHLGSSNILMEPNDQYLCIVPKPGVAPAREVRLPFEGDRTLSVILSKAFLLAEDLKIKDASILKQIKS